jgi:hypothetical protein
MSRRTTLLASLAFACSDYALKGEGEAKGNFDTGDPPPAFETGSQRESVPPEETAAPAACPDVDVPGGALAQVDECAFEPEVGTFTPEVEWTWETFATKPTFENVMAAPIVVSLTDDDGDGDADADDTPDIVFMTYEGTSWTTAGVMRAVSGDGSAAIFDVAGEDIDGCSGLAAGDLDGDGWVEILAVTTGKAVKAFDVTGGLVWTSPALASDMGSYAPAPAISDMDGDGSPEVIVGRAILHADGDLLATGSHGVGGANYWGATSFAVDLDGDGTQEVVTGNAAYDIDGDDVWFNGEADGFVAVGNFDGDDAGEVVVVASATVRLQDDDGDVLWTAAIPKASGSYGGPPTIADYDGDGEAEVGVAANSTYTVFDTDGSMLWQQTTQDASSGVTGSAVFDFEGDGIAEAVYADELTTWAFNGPDGAVKLESGDHSNWTVIEYPVIADVDGDDQAEIVVPNGLHPSYSGAARHGIAVIGDADHSWRAGRRIWNQYAYHITNVEDGGSIPTVADSNWLTYNNFRSGDLAAGSGSSAPDLVVSIAEVCADECAEDRLYVWIRVGNEGYADVAGPVVVVLEGETASGTVTLGTSEVTDVVAGTWVQGVEIDVFGLPAEPLLSITATVDPADAVAECDETDNTDTLSDGLCP